MEKPRAKDYRDLIDATIHGLICVTLDLERQLIVVFLIGKKFELPLDKVAEYSRSGRSLIEYLKKELGK